MCKKWTSFLALFLAFAMAITGMPANYAYAVETEIETETQSEEVLEETTEETLDDEEETIVSDDLEDEIIDDELIEDSEEVEGEDEIPEAISEKESLEEDLNVFVNDWDQTYYYSGGSFKLTPDEGAFSDDNIECYIEGREGWWTKVYDSGNSEDLNHKIDTDNVIEVCYFEIAYKSGDNVVNPEDGKKVKVDFTFDEDGYLKGSTWLAGPEGGEATLSRDDSEYFFQLFQIDDDGKATQIGNSMSSISAWNWDWDKEKSVLEEQEGYGKETSTFSFDSEASTSYIIVKMPTSENEVTYHFNNYDDKTTKCGWYSLSNAGGNGKITFDIHGINTWNARRYSAHGKTYYDSLCYASGDVYFVGDGTININADISASDGDGEIHFAGPTINLKGDIYPGMDIFDGDMSDPEFAEYTNQMHYEDGTTVYYRDKEVFLDEGTLNFNPTKLYNKLCVNGGELNARGNSTNSKYDGCTYPDPLFSELHALGGKINVTQANTVAACLVNQLFIGNADVTINGVNCVGNVEPVNMENQPGAKLKVNATNTGVLYGVTWDGGTCDIVSKKVGVGATGVFGYLNAYSGLVNINAVTTGVNGVVNIGGWSDESDAPEVNINAAIGIQGVKNEYSYEEALIFAQGYKGSLNIYGKTAAVKQPTGYKIPLLFEGGNTVFLSAGNSEDALEDIDDADSITNQKYIRVLLGNSDDKKAKLYSPEGKFIKTVLFKAGELISEPVVSLEKEGYSLVWYKDADHETLFDFESERPEDHIQLYSDWAPNEYILSLDTEGYTLVETSKYEVVDDIISLDAVYDEKYGKLPTLKRIGYTFEGWSIGGSEVVVGENDTVKITANTTLYPVWTPAIIEVTLKAGAEDAVISNDVEFTVSEVKAYVPYGGLLDLNPETTQMYTNVGRLGYELKGWKKEGSSDIPSMTYQMPESTTDESTMNPVTLVAVWEKELTVNAPVLTDVKGESVEAYDTLPKNSKLYLSTTVTVKKKETPADSNVAEIWYRTKDGDYTLYEDAIVVNEDLNIEAFAVEKGVVGEETIVNDSWVSSHTSDIKKLNGGTVIRVYRAAVDTSVIEDETDKAFYEANADFEDSFWAVYVQEYDYTGKPVKPSDVHVYFDTRRLAEKTDYTLSYKNNTNAGEAMMIATFKGNYSGKYEMPFTIKPLDINDAVITLAPVTYTGNAIKPSPKLTYELGGKVVTLGAKDYELVMPEKDVDEGVDVVDGKLVEAGKYEIEVKGKGNYANAEGEKTCFIFEIVPKSTVLMNKTKVTLDKNKFDYIDYEGEAIEPAVTVKDGTKALAPGKLVSNEEFVDPDGKTYDGYSYVYTYLDNTDVGTAKVFVRATGNKDSLTEKYYAGEASTTFTINGLKMSAALVNPKITAAYTPEDAEDLPWEPLDDLNMACPETDYSEDHGVTYKLKVDGVIEEYGLWGISKDDYERLDDDDKRGYDYIYEYVGDTASAGKVKINIIGVNAFTGTKTVQYEIKGKALSTTDIKLDEEYNYTYSGSQKKPGVTVTPKLEGATPLVKDTDYEVSYGENIKAGKNKGTVTITGKGLYTGTVKKTFTIDPMSLEAGGFAFVGFGMKDEEGRYIHLEDVPYEKGGVKLDNFVRFDGHTLVSGTDYTATYRNNTKLGMVVVTLKGKGNFAGQFVGTYNIVQQDLANVGIVATDIVFQDKAGICKPKVTLTDLNGKALAQKTDYDANLVYTYNKSTTVTQKVKVGKTTETRTLVRSAGDLVDLKNDIIPKGTEIRVTVTADGNDKYAGSMFYKGTASTVFRVAGADIAKATVKVADQMMTGERIYITKDDITEITINKVPLAPSDYEIINSSYTKNVGKGRASVTIRGVGNYGGTKVINFNIVVPKAQ